MCGISNEKIGNLIIENGQVEGSDTGISNCGNVLIKNVYAVGQLSGITSYSGRVEIKDGIIQGKNRLSYGGSSGIVNSSNSNLIIESGKISGDSNGIHNYGNVTIGNDEDDVVQSETPQIYGGNCGLTIFDVDRSIVNFFDGKIYGKYATISEEVKSDHNTTESKITNVANGYKISEGKEKIDGENYKTAYLTYGGKVRIPTANNELRYNGKEQIGIKEQRGFTITGNKATNIGKYTALATLADKENTTWTDNTTEDKEITWYISKAKAENDISIDGISKYGETLTANVNTNSDGKISYQWWYADSNTATSGTEIKGATSNTYKIEAEMIGKYVGVSAMTSETETYSAGDSYVLSNKTVEKAYITKDMVNAKIVGKLKVGNQLGVEFIESPESKKIFTTGNIDDYIINYQWNTFSDSSRKDEKVVGRDKKYLISSSEQNKYIELTVMIKETQCYYMSSIIFEPQFIEIEPSIIYRTHVQSIGWQDYVKDGKTSGTSGQALRLEGINIKIENAKLSGDIEYRTHVQNIGWQGYVKNGEMSGTSGQALRLEAISIKLTGDIEKNYDIYYRVHCQSIGWMGWAKNGENAGTAGLAYRLEAIEILLLDKGSLAPGDTENHFKQNIKYQTHIQNIGWQENVNSGETSGTSGRALRLEGIKINLDSDLAGDIIYRTHVQNIGWQDYVKNGEMSGTSGQSLRLEAISIKLTDDLERSYDIYYRVHCQNIGWMGWAKNGEDAGTSGYSYRLEAIQIVLVEKGKQAPGETYFHFKGEINGHCEIN